MADGTSIQAGRADPFSRPEFAPGSYLTAADCALEQNYLLQRLRRHNRQMHDYGVVCGMIVVPASDPAHPWGVLVCPGYAIGPYGDEIEIRERSLLDVRDFLWSAPAASFTTFARARLAIVAVRYQERPDLLKPVPAAPCSCDEPIYAESRIGDGFGLAAIWSLPQAPETPQLCEGTAACPPCPDSPWLPLARVILPAVQGAAITAAMIDNGIRRTL